MESSSRGPAGGSPAGDRFRDNPGGARAYTSATSGSASASTYSSEFYASADAPDPSDNPSPGDALKDALGRVGELKEYVSYYVAAKADAIKLTVRNLVIYTVLGLIGAVVGTVVLVMAVVLLCTGIADGLGNLFAYLFNSRGWYWLGPFLFGVLILGGVAGGVIFGLKWLTASGRKALVAKYEDRQRQQRVNYGHDVEERAGQQRQEEQRAAAR